MKMKIQKNWTSKGNEIEIEIEIGNRGNLTGTMTNKAGTHKVTRIGIVQGRKVMPFDYNGKSAYQVLPSDVYEEIDQALRKSFTTTEKERVEGEIEIAKREYHKALNIGPIEANKWLDRWNDLSDQLSRL